MFSRIQMMTTEVVWSQLKWKWTPKSSKPCLASVIILKWCKKWAVKRKSQWVWAYRETHLKRCQESHHISLGNHLSCSYRSLKEQILMLLQPDCPSRNYSILVEFPIQASEHIKLIWAMEFQKIKEKLTRIKAQTLNLMQMNWRRSKNLWIKWLKSRIHLNRTLQSCS